MNSDATAKVLLTGAGGFIGRMLKPVLERSGYEVIPVYRDPQNATATNGSAETMSFDLREIGAASENFDTIDVVVHLAAAVHLSGSSADERDFHHVNVVGTSDLANRAAASGVRRFVYLSSIKALGPNSVNGPLKPGDEPDPKDAYAISKRDAEKALWSIASGTDIEIVVIRPPLVYGPGLRGNLATLYRLIERGLPFPTGAIDNRRDLVSIYNLCDLIRVCIDHPNAPGNAFHVCDGNSLSTNDIIKYLGSGSSLRARIFSVPLPLLKSLAILCGQSEQLEKLSSNLQVDMTDTLRCLEWSPPYSVVDSFKMLFSEGALS